MNESSTRTGKLRAAAIAACVLSLAAGCDDTPPSGVVRCTSDAECLAGQLCFEGTCQDPPPCATDCNDGNPCTVDSCVRAACVHEPAESSTRCDDGDPCTSGDHCKGLACAAGTPIALLQPCEGVEGYCASTGCVACTGKCPPCRTDLECHDANPCTVDACRDGACTNAPAPETTVCNDQDPCTRADHCQGGACHGESIENLQPCEGQDGFCGPTGCLQCQVDTNCSELDGSRCTVPRCAQGGFCTEVAGNEGGPCSDGNMCTVEDHCVAGTCVTTPKDCSVAPSQCHTGGTCNAETGNCDYPALTGTPCNDTDPCTSGDSCQQGVCTRGEPIAVLAPCEGLEGYCTSRGCVPCTGKCPPCTTDAECDDHNPCTGDFCLEGSCSNPDESDGTPCDDGDPCTTANQCRAGTCNGQPIANMQPCEGRAGFCGPTGCLECQIDAHCGDLDGSPCTIPRCTQGGFCVEVPGNDGAPCNDGNLCSVGDHCAAGACAAAPKDCSVPPSQCHLAGTCNASTGACDYPIRAGLPCNDNNSCSSGDYCNAAGQCVGAPLSRWVNKAAIEYVQADPDNSWGALQSRTVTVDGNVAAVRISGWSDDGGYCYAWWGNGHLALYRHIGSVGYYNLDGRLYGIFGAACPAYPPVFSNWGEARICQGNDGAGGFAYGAGETWANVPPNGGVIQLQARHVIGRESDGVWCYLDVYCP